MQRKRSRQGCSTCRSRHQKCDENKPACHNCERRGVSCGGYELRLTGFEIQSGTNGQMVGRMVRDSGSIEAKKQKRVRRKLSSTKSTGDVARNPSQVGLFTNEFEHTLPQPDDSMHDDVLEYSDDLLDQGSSMARFDYANDATSTRPTDIMLPPAEDFEGTIDSQLVSQTDLDMWTSELDGEIFEMFSNFAEPCGHALPEPAQMSMSTHLPPLDHLSSAFDRYLFSHFWENLALSLYPITEEHNPYRTVYGVLSVESKPLLNSLLCASASHLTEMGHLPHGAVEPYRRNLRKSFRKAMEEGDNEDGMAATVLFSISSGIIGTGLDLWKAKLGGARRLLVSTANKLRPSRARRESVYFLRHQYNWFAVIARITSDYDVLRIEEPPLEYLEETDENSADLAAQLYPSWFCNLTDYTFHLMLREACNLDQSFSATGHLPGRSRSVRDIFLATADLTTRIQSWEPEPSNVLPQFQDQVPLVNEVWRQGLLCYLYSGIYGLPARDSKLQECVTEAMVNIRGLSWIQNIVWPYFFIAVHAVQTEDRKFFDTSLENFGSGTHFKCPQSMKMVLRDVWDDLDANDTGLPRWREIMAENQIELNLTL